MSVKINTSSDNVYVNTLLTHNVSDGQFPSIAKLNINFTEPYLINPSEYYASIIRFDIPMAEVPVLIFPCPAGNDNISSLVIGVTYLGIDYSVNLIYVADPFFPVPNPPDPTNPYYYMYNIDKFVNIINTALDTAIANSGFPLVGQVPFFYYNSSTQLFSVYIPKTFTPTIYVNVELQSYLDGFNWQLVSNSSTNPHHYNLIKSDNPYNTYPSVINAQTNGTPAGVTGPSGVEDAYIFTQDHNNMVYFAELRRIVIVTNTIPIVAENIPAISPNNGNFTGETTNLPIFSDFVPNFRDTTDIRSIAYYRPTGQYLLHDMKGDGLLNKFDLQIYWEDSLGRLNPFYLSTNQTASIKVAFLKKTLYNNIKMLI